MVIKGRRIGLGIELSEGMMILPIITESIFSHNWIRGLLSRTDFLRAKCVEISGIRIWGLLARFITMSMG